MPSMTGHFIAEFNLLSPYKTDGMIYGPTISDDWMQDIKIIHYQVLNVVLEQRRPRGYQDVPVFILSPYRGDLIMESPESMFMQLL